MNIVLLGALVFAMDLRSIDWERIIGENVKPVFLELNRKAFQMGRNFVSGGKPSVLS